MKKRSAVLLLSLLLLSLMLWPGSRVEARRHWFRDLRIKAQIGADGVVRVTETHVVEFEGEFFGMFQWIDTGGGLEVKDLIVTENGVPFRRLDGDSPGPTGTFYVRTRENEVYVDWSFEAANETRIFVLSYSLDNVVLKHNDVAEFYYKFVGDRWDDPRDRVSAVLTIPYGAEQDEILAWGHGPSQGTVKINSPQEIVWQVDALPAKTFVEGRVVFPVRLVPLAKRVTGKNALEEILKEEEGKIKLEKRAEKLKELDSSTALVVLAILAAVYFSMWKKFVKPHPGFEEKYFKELPADYPPAVLAVLLRREIDGNVFIATLLDLARRGYLSIQEKALPRRRWGKEKYSYEFVCSEVKRDSWQTLEGFEQNLLSFLFEANGSGRITLEEIEEYGAKKKKEFVDFWEKWKEKIEKEAAKHGFFEGKANREIYRYSIPLFSLLVFSGLTSYWGMYYTGTACLVGGLFVLIMISWANKRLSPRGSQDFTKWKAFERYLKDYSRLEISRIGAVGIWEEYLAYAFVLGISERVIKQLEIVFPNLRDQQRSFGEDWFIYHQSFSTRRFNQLTKTMDTTVKLGLTTSGSGGGGSFSSGGGGGAGGGGGGVR